MTKILKRKTVQIAALWIVAVIISNVSFYFIWREWPSTNDIVIGHTVYTLLALPFSFVHTAIFYNEPALKIRFEVSPRWCTILSRWLYMAYANNLPSYFILV